MTVGGSKKRRRDSGGSGGSGGGGEKQRSAFGRKKKGAAAAASGDAAPAAQPDEFLGAEAEARMAERKAQRQRLCELREKSLEDGDDDGDDGEPAGKKQKKDRKPKKKDRAPKNQAVNEKVPKKEKLLSKFKKKPDPPLDGNELLTKWRTNRASLPIDFERLLDPTLDEERRGDLFEAEDEDAQEKYAWAIPDERALKACAAFSPLVEMGAGAGYWARMLRDMGCTVHPFDCDVGAKARAAGVLAPAWTSVAKGGPEKLGKYPGAALLMLYPDDLSEGGHQDGASSALFPMFTPH